MLTFKQYCRQHMNEAFLDAIKYQGDMLEVFVNPSTKEWRELNKDGNIRWVIDMDGKKIWAWNGELGIHNPVLEKIKPKHPEIKLTASHDWEKHVQYLGNWIAGNTERSLYERVDTYDWIEGELRRISGQARKDYLKEAQEEIVHLLTKDFTWINKYGPKGELIKETAVRFLADLLKIELK